MSEIDMDRINTAIEREIRKYANSVELADDETVLRVTISNDVVLGKEFAMGWWLDFIGQAIFQWDDRTFYCCDVEPTEDSHIWIFHPIDLHDAFPIQTERGIEASNQGQLEHQEALWDRNGLTAQSEPPRKHATRPSRLSDCARSQP
jgi:hypothetical protein